jgi:hypothetical protein
VGHGEEQDQNNELKQNAMENMPAQATRRPGNGQRQRTTTTPKTNNNDNTALNKHKNPKCKLLADGDNINRNHQQQRRTTMRQRIKTTTKTTHTTTKQQQEPKQQRQQPRPRHQTRQQLKRRRTTAMPTTTTATTTQQHPRKDRNKARRQSKFTELATMWVLRSACIASGGNVMHWAPTTTETKCNTKQHVGNRPPKPP